MVELISVHVPKTAGTTFRDILNQIYGKENIYFDYIPPKYVKHEPSDLPHNFRVIHGHFNILKYDCLHAQAKKIIWLRHPIHIVISLYFYWLHVPLGDIYQCLDIVRDVKMLNINLEEFVEHGAAKNLISQYISGKKINDFDFVGVNEFFLEDLADLQKMLNWSDFRIYEKNTNPNPKYQEELESVFSQKTLIEKILRNNQEDLEIYQEALRLRAERRKESLVIQPIMAEWKRSQHRVRAALKDVRQKEVELAKARSELWQVKAELFLEKNELDEALTACEQALKIKPEFIKPEFALACLTMGNIWLAKGQADKAKNCYDRAVSIQPTLVEALENLGNICMEQQLWSEAIACYQKLLVVQPSVAGVYRNLATALYNENKLEESADCMYIALTLEAEKSTALDYFNLGNSFLNQNRVERAIICYRRAKEQLSVTAELFA